MRWLVTGVSTGFGRELARIVAKSGDQLLGTVRQPEQVPQLASEGIGATVMDVNDQHAVEAAHSLAMSRFGGIDVLVNNAGFGMAGAIEALSLEEVRAVMETNFFGALRVTKAFLPSLRAAKGTIVMISSMAGQVGLAGAGAYCASKAALEGLSDSLAEELAPFGANVLIVEPGSFRTDFAGRSVQGAATTVKAYGGMQAGDIQAMMADFSGREPGDPVKAAEAIVAAVRSARRPRRLSLGSDALEAITKKAQAVLGDMDAWRATSLATALD